MRASLAILGVLALHNCTGKSSAKGSALSGPIAVLEAPAVAAVATARPPAAPTLSLKAQVGKHIFFDETLSASQTMSCATCHDPAFAYGPPNDRAVQLGGPGVDRAGTRAVPSLRYKEYTPAYADLLDNPDGMSAPGPGGGFAWDGRADTLAEQAKLPLLSPLEMANASPADVVAKVRASSYAALFQKAFAAPDTRADAVARSDDHRSDIDKAFDDVVAALQAFQLEDPSFHPYTSKFDLHAGNKIGGAFTPAEARGFRVFADANKGNCASCHFPGAGINGSSGLFTDFSYEAIGVPRNLALSTNEDATYYDLGLCGPLRTDHATPSAGPNAFCGMFKTPTLRNTAGRKVFFHNGVVHSLEQAVRFYNTRDTSPELWYPTKNGQVQKFDDLPKAYRANVDRQMPLDGRARGAKKPMSEAEMADLICFIKTLTDDYQPPAAPPASGPCVD